MSDYLAIYIGENIKFDLKQTINAIYSIKNSLKKKQAKTNINTHDHYSFYFDFKWQNDSVSVGLDQSQECFFVSSLRRASLVFAHRLQKQMPSVDLLATDSDYSFVCQLNKISSIKEFEKVISQRIYMNG